MILLAPTLKKLTELLPDIDLTVICEKRNLPVLGIFDLKCNHIAYDEQPLALITRLVKGQYDVTIDTEQFHHLSAVLSVVSGAPVRIGFNINPRRNHLYTHTVSYEVTRHESLQFARLIEPLGRTPEQSPAGWARNHEPEQAQKIAEMLQDNCNNGYFLLHPGSRTVYKQWPEHRYVKLGVELHNKTGHAIVLAGDASERGLALRISDALSAQHVPCCVIAGISDFESTAATLKNAVCVIGNDSCLAHLAYAFDVPAVTLFGPSDPRKWAAPTSRQRVVSNGPACAPCAIFGYHNPCNNIACMQSITANQVLGETLQATADPG